MRRAVQIWAVLLVLGFAGTLIWRALPRTASITGSDLVFDQPASWYADDITEYLDPAWAIEQKRLHPGDAALIDSLIDGIRSGEISYSAWIDLDARDPEIDGWIKGNVSQDAGPPAELVAKARSSVDYQPVRVRPGTSAVEVQVAGGSAARLDWSFDLTNADGTSDVTYVRAYWMADGPSLVIVQLTTYGEHPDAVAVFDSVAATYRWRP
jgi:hypothetical protein